MPSSKSVEEIACAIEKMNQADREDLLLRLAKIDGLLEDLEDIADIVRAAHEQSRPFDDFLADLRSEGHEV